MEYPKSFKNLIEAFERLPGIGYKSAERMAYSFINLSEEYKQKFSEAIDQLSNLKHCRICHNLSDEDECEICKDVNRDSSLLCVVSDYKDVFQYF